MAEPTLDTSTSTFEDLDSQYGHFFAPAFQIKIGGKDIVKDLGAAVSSVTATTTVQMEAGHFSFSVGNAYDWVKRDFQWLDTIAVGKEVEILMGYVDKLKTVFTGVITSMSFDYPAEGNPTFSVQGMDYSYMLMKGKNADGANTWLNKSHSDVVKEIAKLYGLNTKNVDDTPVEERFGRDGRDDFRLISDWATLHDYEFFVLGKMLYFREPPYSKTTAFTTLTYGQNLRSFSTKVDISSQVTQFVVRGFDKEHKPIEAKSKPISPIGSNSSLGSDVTKSLGSGKVHYEYTNMTTVDKLQKRADALAREHAMKLIQGSGESIGIPDLIAGRFIKLNHVGAKFNNQPLYMVSVAHTINSSGYLTSFEVRGNAM
ncbi:MAG: hypothetical protein WCC10_01315 [Tumebacillaceae bacterium]